MNHEIIIPGSKSISNRALILAGMSSTPITLNHFLYAKDTTFGLSALQSLGFLVKRHGKNNAVTLTQPHTNLPENQQHKKLFLGKAGTLARFFPAVILNWQNTFPNSRPLSVTLDGEEQLQNRPLQDLIVALKQLGGNISSYCLPMKILPSVLKGDCEISGSISGQFLSGLLLAACGAKNKIKIRRTENLVQPDYIKITLKMIGDFGGDIVANKELTEFHVFPVPQLSCANYNIEPDASTACYFIVLSFLHNFNLKIKNLGSITLQPDYKLVYLLQKMGACIDVQKNETHILKHNLTLPFEMPQKIDCSEFSDQALTLGVLALFGQNPVEIFGISHIRHHESNRISCFVQNLNELGFFALEQEDGFVVSSTGKNLEEINGVWKTHDDHRFVMVGFLLSTLCPNITIENKAAVEKTAPEFFHLATQLGF